MTKLVDTTGRVCWLYLQPHEDHAEDRFDGVHLVRDAGNGDPAVFVTPEVQHAAHTHAKLTQLTTAALDFFAVFDSPDFRDHPVELARRYKQLQSATTDAAAALGAVERTRNEAKTT